MSSTTALPASSDTRRNLLDLAPLAAEAELRAFAKAHSVPEYLGGQVARRLWMAPASSFDEIVEIPKAFRALLSEHFVIPRLALDTEQTSTDGTRKFLFRLADGQAIETVAIPDGDRMTLCISSQAGCALQCSFCATGA